VEGFFDDIQGGIRDRYTDSSNLDRNKEKVINDSPEVGNFIQDFENMVE
jgi:hypothetical protein